MKLHKVVAVPAIALAAGLSLAACGTTVVQPAAPVKPAATSPAPTTHAATTPAAAASAPQIIINNNNAAAPASTQPAQPAAQSDPWSVAVAYTNDVNSGDASDAWNLLGPSVQAGWSDYSAFASWVGQTSFSNVNEDSESGDAVTFTFTLSNSAGTDVPYTATFTVDNGIITSSTSSQN